jgi:hypothetical protein
MLVEGGMGLHAGDARTAAASNTNCTAAVRLMTGLAEIYEY